jgi:hypothetical protein
MEHNHQRMIACTKLFLGITRILSCYQELIGIEKTNPNSWGTNRPNTFIEKALRKTLRSRVRKNKANSPDVDVEFEALSAI